MLLEAAKLAWRAISRNLLRSFLTVLGVVIGVAAVIAMVTIGNGTTAKVRDELSRLGTNTLFIRPGQWGPGRASTEAKRFNDKDVLAIKEQVSGLRGVAPINRGTATVIAGGANHSSSAVGTTNDYFIVQDWDMALGRNFNPNEDRGSHAACIIGETVRKQLFGAANPVGQLIRVSNIACPVVGVLAVKGQSGMGDDQDDTVIMPLKLHQRRIGGTTTISSIVISAQDGVSTAKVQSDVEGLLRERRRIAIGRDDDFSVNDMSQIAAAMTGTTVLLTGLLGAVAAVSLLVGGIGIMNIMLVSVTERTREIGIRLAIGALESQVLRQFLVEAVMLSIFGGVTGIITGLALAYGVVSFLQVPFVASPTIILMAFAFSAAIGMIFGYFPARRAAQLNPIEALRHE
ncbi:MULTISPECIES: ABC transporter permease [Rhizobium/Agrobacterium group]|jgi:putative ABC transport system permease protein|uniref:Putative ABC transport system permease protein n=1 Tax=Rhizobium soli TaxID=424798 RepID=A0A7X0MPR0_9HYPH|nr:MULTISPECIES: ABC transporter permease [Rhizobium/Agrobacterium group]KQQ36994.1 multidrug ABC transporter substrate-binding protein [Rhizobium sp. Leaf306]MBB6506734.1 putative ABC transport system permease protein [Rhizobium soli]MBD8650504.1 ABC transporter permease [Rhizobium sp. CFBP 13726]MBP2461234.1 putative ABC transport system permease protein [Rhizobium sp. PvP014]MBP2528630.1 putative ABC transport system permease protein [Rhizobium sp. PvP099]